MIRGQGGGMMTGVRRYRKARWSAAGVFLALGWPFFQAWGAVSRLECGGAAGAGWLFCNDFDTGVTTDEQRRAQWDDYDQALDVTFLENPGPSGAAGNHVARLRAPAGARGGADLIKELPVGHRTLFTRWFIYYEPGFNFNAPNHGGGLHAGDRNILGHSGTRPNGHDWFSAWVDYGPGVEPYFRFYTYYPGMYCTDPNNCFGDIFPSSRPTHEPVLMTGRWYCVETEVDAGTPSPTSAGADGALTFWMDGREIVSEGNLWMRATPDLTPWLLYLSLFHHDGTHSVEGVYYDNVVAGTSRIGCDSPGTASPPAPPRGLRAQ